MKRIKILTSFSMFVLLFFVLNSCTKDKLYSTYTYFEPVLENKATVLNSIGSIAARPLHTTGKLVKFGNFIFVNEINKGIHIIDNSNPSGPVNKSFINIPGNIDIAIKGNTLYADIYTDLVVIDISNPGNARVKKVIPNVFPERQYQNAVMQDTMHYITGWNKKTTTDKSEYERLKNFNGMVFLYSSMSGAAQQSTASIGISGSMARFTIVNNYLYTVGQQYLTSFNISTTDEPKLENKKSIGWNIETIYPFKDKLFIGSKTGMYIFSLATASDPVLLGQFQHACFNDPVIADEQYAYVTLRANTDASTCWGPAILQRNELDIINISNIQSPMLEKVYDFVAPQGLSKDGNVLFICDNAGGLKIFNAANPISLSLVKHFTDIKPFDVIAQDHLAIVVAEAGIYQYDYSNINSIKRISKISIEK